MRKVIILCAGILVLGLTLGLTLGACGRKDNFDTSRGRGDAPIKTGGVDNTPKEVIQFPDRFSNVAHACDGHGHRIYVTTKSDESRFMVAIADSSCNTPG